MIHALVAGLRLAQMVSFCHLLLLHMEDVAPRLLFAGLLGVSCITDCLLAPFLAAFEAGTRWELAVVLHLLHTRVRSVQSLVACCSLAFRICVALHFFHLLLSRDRAGPCAHAQSFVGKSVNDKRAFVEDCNAPWFAHVLRVFRISTDPDSSRPDIFFSESCCSCIISFQCVMCMQALPR